MATLKNLLAEVLSQWPDVNREKFKGHPFANRFRNDYAEQLAGCFSDDYPELSVLPHIGQSHWAEVLGLAVVHPLLTDNMKTGLFPVYLFKADGSGVYLSLNQGTSDKDNQARAQKLRNKIPALSSWGDADIDLCAAKNAGQAFVENNIVARYYPKEALADEQQLIDDLRQLLAFYRQALRLLDLLPKAKLSSDDVTVVDLPKPFVLLAGISGTGKSRFVREQARLTGSAEETYLLVSVRPDWHEPSDLLGYVSRLGSLDAEYVVTDTLRFMVRAWQEVIADVTVQKEGELCWQARDFDEVRPYWLCLDEMNLAPVEQYFADYLSVLETRQWYRDGNTGVDSYRCAPLLKPDTLAQLDDEGRERLAGALGLSGDDALWQYFVQSGIAIPPNLIVAGTVNMDETTHGFSRKVIDRALTIDFGLYFPNDFEAFFKPDYQPKALDFCRLSHVTLADLEAVEADSCGTLTIGFLTEVNRVLKGTPFELAYRALNELLLMVVCFGPDDRAALEAVWDDFLMCKVLPRIDGDSDKLAVPGEDLFEQRSMLDELEDCLSKLLGTIWSQARVEWLIEDPHSNRKLVCDCRSRDKLAWMKKRLQVSGFTSFWP